MLWKRGMSSMCLRRRNFLLASLTIISCLLASCQSFVVQHSPAISDRSFSRTRKQAGAFRTETSSSGQRLRFLSAVKKEIGSLDPADAPPFSVTVEGDNIDYKDALTRTAGWASAAFLFGAGIWTLVSPEAGEEFFAGYLVEQSLSVDNLFVFLLLFDYFKVPLSYQDRVLNWGIYGAVVMRAVMIGLGAAALERFHEILLVFAGILVYSSIQVLVGGEDEEEDPGQNSIVKFSRSLIPSTEEFDGDRFFTLINGVKTATPLFICMIAVEISDVVFAVDSIPAVFGVTENPLVVFSSNIFAIMGLRSLYTILSKAAGDLKYLEPAVAVVLGFIGGKMIAEYYGFVLPTNIALAAVASMLGAGVGASLIEQRNNSEEHR